MTSRLQFDISVRDQPVSHFIQHAMVRLWLVRVLWFAYFLVSSILGLKALHFDGSICRSDLKQSVQLSFGPSQLCYLCFQLYMDPTQTNSIPELGVLWPVCRFLNPRSQGNVNPLQKVQSFVGFVGDGFYMFVRSSDYRQTPSRYLPECSKSKTCPLSLQT